MSRAIVNAGSCGYEVVVEVTRLDRDTVRVVLDSPCEQVMAMNEALAALKWRGQGREVFGPIDQSAVYRSAGCHLRHTACPIPAAILKAIEVEVGITLPRDVVIKLEK